MNSPFRYPGGKHYARKIILPYLPGHRVYVEPFAGGGSIFFAKPTTSQNWLNDVDPELINVYRHIRDHVELLIGWLADLPVNKETHAHYKNEFQPQNDLDRAGRWYYLNRTSYSGIMTPANCYFGYSPRHCMKPAGWPKRLRAASQKLRGTKLTGLDFADVIAQSPDGAFLFIDPPYFAADGGLYTYPFGIEDHERLAQSLHRHRDRIKFLLTYDDSPQIRRLYRWAETINEAQWLYTVGRSDDQTGKSKKTGQRQNGREILITNYVPVAARQMSLFTAVSGREPHNQ